MTGRVAGTVTVAGAVASAVTVAVNTGAVTGIVDASAMARTVASAMTGINAGIIPPNQPVEDLRRGSGHILGLGSQVRSHPLHQAGHLIGGAHQRRLTQTIEYR